MSWLSIPALVLLAMLPAGVAAAADLDYRLQPVLVAADTYVFAGYNEDFSFDNGGNIVNTGFIVTEAGVVDSLHHKPCGLGIVFVNVVGFLV